MNNLQLKHKMVAPSTASTL